MNPQPELSLEQKHSIWKKNSGYLYDRLVVYKMKWPSLTFQWLPTYKQTQTGVAYEILVATHTSGERETQFINILQVQFPHLKDLSDPNPSMQPAKIKKVQEFKHELEPNRARCSQSNPDLIAVRVDNGPIAIFKRGAQFPQTVLNGHIFDAGFGLEWTQNGLISGDHKGTIAFWPNIEYDPYKFEYNCEIEDAKTINNFVFTSVSDDGAMCIWDTRSGKIENKIIVSDQQVDTVAINPVNNNLILTAGQQGVVKLWDARSYSRHEKGILNVQWSPKTPTIFASGSQDGKVKIWDLLRVGFEIPKDNSGTQQLLFTHEGHRDEVLDIGWNPYCMLLGSVEENFNTLQLYEISNCIQDLEFTEDMQFLRMQCLS